jgi:hypothetical protein
LATGKISPQNAFELARDARIAALEKAIIAKGAITRAELDHQQEQEFSRTVAMIQKMPSIPKQ